MADDDRQPPQAYDTVAPAGVGATTSNQVSPGTIQEILDTGDQNLIDQAFDQMEEAGDYDALTDISNRCLTPQPSECLYRPLPPLG